MTLDPNDIQWDDAPAPSQAPADVKWDAKPAEVVDTTQTMIVPAEQDTSNALKLAPEDEKEVARILAESPTETAASEARQYLASKGFSAGPATVEGFKGDSLDQIIEYRRQHGVVNKEVDYLKPKPTDSISEQPGQANALARGIADVPTMGFMDELYGVAQALKNPSDHGFEHDMNAAIDRYRGAVDSDEKEHMPTRVAGQLIGGLGIPLTYEGVALRGFVPAARQALTSGATREAAIQAGRRAAAQAARNAMIRDGAYIGGAHGVGSGEDIEGRLGGGVAEAALGAAGGAAAGAVGEVIAPRLATARPPLTEGQEVGQAAERLGMDVLPADVGGPTTRRLTGASAQAPLSASPIIRAAQRVVDQGRAVRDRVAADVGEAAASAEAAGEAASEGARNFIRTSRSRIGRIYDIAATQAGDARVPLPNAIQTLDEQIARMREVPGGATGLREAEELRASLEGDFTVQGVRDMRTEMFVAPDFRGTPVERRLRQIVDAAAVDIEQGLRAQGNGRAADTFREADRQWRERLSTISRVIEPIIGKSEDKAKSGEEVIAALERAAKGNGRRLERFIGSLPPDEQDIVRASLISRLGRQSAGRQNADGDGFSLNDFLTHWSQMGERARQVTFGAEGRAALNDLARVAEGTKEAQKYANFSNTGGAIWGNLGLLGGAGAYAPKTAAAAAVFQVVGGRLLASPRFARWLARAPRTDLSREAYTDRLGRIAKAEPAIAADVLSLQQRLAEAFSEAPMKAAATDTGEDTSQKQ